MSLESAKAFIDRMNRDEEFIRKLFACKDIDAQKAFIRSAGYSFTRDEINQLVDLSDEELETVAGGFCGCGYFPG